MTVNGYDAEPHLAWPVATRLYWPRAWTEDSARRAQAHGPQAITFQTKAEIALALLDEEKAMGIPHRAVVTDADYGDNPHFLNGLEARGERYVVAVRTDFTVAQGRTAGYPARAGRYRIARRAGAGLANASLARGHPGPVAGEIHRPAVLPCRRRRHASSRLADWATAGAGAKQSLEILLE